MGTWRDEDIKGQKDPFEYIFTCHSSRCDYTEYNGGKTPLLVLEGERELLKGPNAGKREEAHLWLSVGKDFRPSADKSRIEHKNGDPEARLNPKCKAQLFIASWFDNGAGDVLKTRGENALDARMFAGLKFRVQEEETSFKMDGEKKEGRQPLMVEYLGEVGGAPAAAASNGSDTAAIEALAKEMKANGNDDVDFFEKAHNEFGLPLDSPVLAATWAKV